MTEYITIKLREIRPSQAYKKHKESWRHTNWSLSTLIGTETRNTHQRASRSLPKSESPAILTDAVWLHAGAAKTSRLKTEVLGVFRELERWHLLHCTNSFISLLCVSVSSFNQRVRGPNEFRMEIKSKRVYEMFTNKDTAGGLTFILTGGVFEPQRNSTCNQKLI